MSTYKLVLRLAGLAVSSLLAVPAFATAQDASVCPRFAEGSIVENPPTAPADSSGTIRLTARNIGAGPVDEAHPRYDYRFCLLGNNNFSLEGPVIRTAAGKSVPVLLSNRLIPEKGFPTTHVMTAPGARPCTARPSEAFANISLTNLHFHGLNVSPQCGGDEVINTLTGPPGSGATADYRYRLAIPKNEPPGLYWYHPHVHGTSQQQILGGMASVIVVEGIEKFYPEVSGLKERIFVLRDMDKPDPADDPKASPDEPWKNVSVNYVPVIWKPPPYAQRLPQILIGAGERQFWRIANAAADTSFVLKLQFRDHGSKSWQDQPMTVIGRDGVPITDDDGHALNSGQVEKTVVLPPGARVEFIMTGPSTGVEARLFSADYNAYLLGLNPNPKGSDATDRQPARTLAELVVTPNAARPDGGAAMRSSAPRDQLQRFTGMRKDRTVRTRQLFFTKDERDDGAFFLTVEGNVPKPFQMDGKPDIVVNMPAVEEWTVENRDNESHVFHIHQVHFRVVERNGIPTDDHTEQTLVDTVVLPACQDWGSSNPDDPYANDPTFLGKNCRSPARVKLRMEFRQPDIAGTFVYHCHILEHEDKGMMAKIELVWDPPAAARTAALLRSGGMNAVLAQEQQARNNTAAAALGNSIDTLLKKLGAMQASSLIGRFFAPAGQSGKPTSGEVCTAKSPQRTAAAEKIRQEIRLR